MKKLIIITLLLTSNAYALDCRTIKNSAQPVSDEEIRVGLRCLPNEELLGITCNVEDIASDGEGYGAGVARYVGDKGACIFYPVSNEVANIDELDFGQTIISETYGKVFASAKCCK